jgi:phosphotransferase system  glucose/maltose/N-acetylglucosamine-specific IIC component
MKCEKAIEKYLTLDNKQSMPLTLRIHLLLCKQCKHEIDQLRIAISSLQMPPYTVSLEDYIMAQIANQRSYHQSVSDINWIASGIIIILSIGGISYSDALHWLTEHFGNQIQVPIYLVLGCIISGYIGSYVASHMKKLGAIAQNIKSLL